MTGEHGERTEPQARGRHTHDFQWNTDLAYSRRCVTPGCDVIEDVKPNHHPYRLLRAPEGNRAAIDEGIAGLVIECWGAGVRTSFSCQGGCARGDRLAYLAFDPAGHDKVAEILGQRPGLVWELTGTMHNRDWVARWEAAEPCRHRAEEDQRETHQAMLAGLTVDIAITGPDGSAIRSSGPGAVDHGWTAWDVAVAKYREAADGTSLAGGAETLARLEAR